MTVPRLTYLSMDSVLHGVGASQVLPYVKGLCARGVSIELHSFEPEPPSVEAHAAMASSGLDWTTHAFGARGSLGGLGRIARGALAVRNGEIVHARSDLAAASAVVSRPRAWVWDMRSFWIDQRVAIGAVRPGSASERLFRRVEAAAARQSSAIVTLSEAAIDELARCHGEEVRSKARVITTCVDLDRFAPTPLPEGDIRLLLSGSFNPLYDLSAMLAFTAAIRQRVGASLTLLRPEHSSWDDPVRAVGGTVASSTFDEMPVHVQGHHAGLVLCERKNPRALMGAMPTKVGEFLACGRPVVVSSGIGDLDALISESRAGAVVRGDGPAALAESAEVLLGLLADPTTPGRCRSLAEKHFSLSDGIESLAALYADLA